MALAAALSGSVKSFGPVTWPMVNPASWNALTALGNALATFSGVTGKLGRTVRSTPSRPVSLQNAMRPGMSSDPSVTVKQR